MVTLRKEFLNWVRNSDFLSTTVRGTTTKTDTDTLTAATEYIINRTNVKNIRSLSMGATELTLGKDYEIDFDYLSTTIKCRITFTAAQTGTLEVIYDYGTDKIYDDYPRDDLKINSYPRIAVIQLSKNTDAFGIGGESFISNTVFSLIVYSENQDFIQSTLDSIESELRTDAKSFYIATFAKPIGRGPIIKPDGRGQTILLGNTDCEVMFEVDNN